VLEPRQFFIFDTRRHGRIDVPDAAVRPDVGGQLLVGQRSAGDAHVRSE